MPDVIPQTAQQLRRTIEQAQDAGADIPWLPRFPNKCCNFAANLLLIDLCDAGVMRLRRMIGTVTDDKGDDLANHVWVEADGRVVDITADCYGQDKVIAAENSDWHASLEDIKPFIARIDRENGITTEELNRLRDLYADAVSVLAQHRGTA